MKAEERAKLALDGFVWNVDGASPIKSITEQIRQAEREAMRDVFDAILDLKVIRKRLLNPVQYITIRNLRDDMLKD